MWEKTKRSFKLIDQNCCSISLACSTFIHLTWNWEDKNFIRSILFRLMCPVMHIPDLFLQIIYPTTIYYNITTVTISTYHSEHIPKLKQTPRQPEHTCSFLNHAMQLSLTSSDCLYHFQFSRFLNWYHHELNRNQPPMSRETFKSGLIFSRHFLFKYRIFVDFTTTQMTREHLPHKKVILCCLSLHAPPVIPLFWLWQLW